MKHISKKTWFALSVAIVAISAVFALKKPVQKEKSSHVVVDRLVNQLVCKISSGSPAKGYRHPRGVLGFAFSNSKVFARGKQRPGGDEYTLRSSQKVVAKRQGWNDRGERRQPVGGDF